MSINKKTVSLLKKIKDTYSLSKEDKKELNAVLAKHQGRLKVELDKQFLSAASWSEYRPEVVIDYEKLNKLLKEGADVDGTGFVGNFGENALQRAIKASKWDLVEFLIKNGADIRLKNKDGLTGIHLWLNEWKSDKADCDDIDRLLSFGFDVNERALDGRTPIFFAVEKNQKSSNFKYIQKLLDLGADLEAKNNDGETVIDYAKKVNSSSAEFLEEYKANKENQVLINQIEGDVEIDRGFSF